MSPRCPRAADPVAAKPPTGSSRNEPRTAALCVPGTRVLTRLPTQEPHTVGLAGSAPVVAHKPIILAFFVDDLSGEVNAIRRRGLGTARELQSKIILMCLTEEGDDSRHKHPLTHLKPSLLPDLFPRAQGDRRTTRPRFCAKETVLF